MKSSRSSVHCKAHTIPNLKFEEQTLTSFAGLVMIQAFFTCIDLKAKLSQCFEHLKSGKIFGHTTIFLQLLIHILLGYRDLRDSRFYRDDPLVKATESRTIVAKTLGTFSAFCLRFGDFLEFTIGEI